MSRLTLVPDNILISAEDQIRRFMADMDPFGEAASEREAQFREARADYHQFMRLMYPNYVEGEHLIALREALVAVESGDITRLIVTMPPRHSKSLHVSEGFPAWFLGRNPHKRVIAASHTMTLARKFSRRVRHHFRDPMWPFTSTRISKASASVEQWEIDGSPTGGYLAVGVGGSPTGQGGDLIIVDDPIKSEADASSALVRENIWEWFEGTLYTRRQPGAAMVVTATRWHEDDLTGRLLQRMKEGGERWEHIHFPAWDDTEGWLWPEFWDEDEYEKAKLASDRVWMAQYMGSPVKKGGNLIKEEWFPDITPGERYYKIIQSWDCAEEPGLTNDYSVCVTIGVSVRGYDILHVWRDQVEFPDLVQASKDQATWITSVYPGVPYEMVIENASAGRQLIQTLRRDTRLPVHSYTPKTEKDAKIQRVIRVTPTLKSRRVRVRNGVSWRVEFMREMKGFPYEAHDDIVDGTMIGIEQASGLAVAGASSRDYMQSADPEPDKYGARRRPPGPTAVRR